MDARDRVTETVTEPPSGFGGAGTAVVVYLVLLLAMPQQLVVGPLGFAGSPATVWGMACFLWWVWFHVHRVHGVGEPRAIRWAALAFLAAVLLSYTRAMSFPMAGDEISVADAGVLRVLSWLGVMLLAADGLRGFDDWWRVADWLTGLCAVLALLAVVQTVTGQAWVDRISIPGLVVNVPIELTDAREGLVRPIGTATHAIEFGQILTVGFVISAAMALVRATAVHRIVVVLTAMAALLTVSRSAILSILVALLVLGGALTRRQRLIGLGVGVVVGVSAYLVRPGLLGTLTRMFTGIEGDASARSRTDSYDYAFHAFSTSPLIGKGFATFLPKYRILDNQWLLSAIEIGAIGVLTLLVLLVVVVRSGLRAARTLGDHEGLAVRSCAAAVVALGVGMLFYDGFAFPQATGLLFVAAGLATASLRLSAPPRGEVEERAPRPVGADPDHG